MSASTAKRLILYRFDRQPVEALVHTDSFLTPAGAEIMLRDGAVQVVDFKSIKAMCFAVEGAPFDLFTAETGFGRRPKVPGLWARFAFTDGDVLEGVLPHSVLDWPEQGYYITPPRANTYRQRVFVPRSAVREVAMLGLVGKATPARKVVEKKLRSDTERQMSMFE